METEVGKITHFYKKIGVAIVEITLAPLKVGDLVRIRGKHTDFTQPVTSMEIEHQKVQEAVPGQVIGLQVIEPVHELDSVFKIVEETP